MTYDRKFYEGQANTSLRSARAIVPAVLQWLPVQSVCDVGCGIGTWLHAFEECGVREVLGIDGDYVDRSMLLIDKTNFRPHDLATPLHSDRTYDLAMSLEVAEHLPESAAKTFVASLVSLAPVVLFSAAIPFQGGAHHVNERWQSYWAALFREHGYVPVDCVRARFWNDAGIEFWYRQNTVLYVKESALNAYPNLPKPAADGDTAYPFDIVHPDCAASIASPSFFHAIKIIPHLFTRGVRDRLAHFAGSRRT
jgi:SAM-dependent methyltransferase